MKHFLATVTISGLFCASAPAQVSFDRLVRALVKLGRHEEALARANRQLQGLLVIATPPEHSEVGQPESHGVTSVAPCRPN